MFTKNLRCAKNSFKTCHMLETQSYRTILKVRLADRITANPAYSLRAMAANVKLSPSLLSEVLKGKKNLSVESALQVARGLKFSTHETEVFALLVQLESTKSPELKASLLERLNALQPQAKVHDLNLDVFRSISEWYHLAILEMTQIKDMQLTPEKAAKALGISVHEAAAAIERLVRLELLEKDERDVLRKTTNLLLATAKVPNQALRTYPGRNRRRAR